MTIPELRFTPKTNHQGFWRFPSIAEALGLVGEQLDKQSHRTDLTPHQKTIALDATIKITALIRNLHEATRKPHGR